MSSGPRILTTVVGSYPVPDWLVALPSEQALIDATSFYNIRHTFVRELGNDMSFLAWRDAGLNPYGNSIIANGA
ncbi:MAG TPA: hypothetical protein VF342_15120 [Alphaproteobacteria bacterium]